MADQENNENQPAFENNLFSGDRTDRQRDMGSGLDVGTAQGVGPKGSDPYPDASQSTPTGPDADPYSGVGNGEGIATGQYRGSDDGTTLGTGTESIGSGQAADTGTSADS